MRFCRPLSTHLTYWEKAEKSSQTNRVSPVMALLGQETDKKMVFERKYIDKSSLTIFHSFLIEPTKKSLKKQIKLGKDLFFCEKVRLSHLH